MLLFKQVSVGVAVMLLHLACGLTGVVLGALTLAFVKWFVHRPRKVEMPLDRTLMLLTLAPTFIRTTLSVWASS